MDTLPLKLRKYVFNPLRWKNNKSVTIAEIFNLQMVKVPGHSTILNYCSKFLLEIWKTFLDFAFKDDNERLPALLNITNVTVRLILNSFQVKKFRQTLSNGLLILSLRHSFDPASFNFCPRVRNSQLKDQWLSRLTWPGTVYFEQNAFERASCTTAFSFRILEFKFNSTLSVTRWYFGCDAWCRVLI